MATELTVIDCARNSGSTAVAATVVSTSTGVYVDCNDIDASKLIFQVTTTAADQYILVKAGMYSAEGIGDLSVASTGQDTLFIGPVETARFKDTDGYINIIPSTLSSAAGITVRAILLP